MLEVLFNDSAKGTMRAAKNYTGGSVGAVSVVGEAPNVSKLSKRELRRLFADEEGESVGGSSKDVVCIGFNLDMGDISGEFDCEKRRDEYTRIFEYVRFENGEADRFFDSKRADFEKMLLAAKSGEPLRVWKSKAPYSVCGFAFLCDVLRNIDCKLSVVELPESVERTDGTIQSFIDWAEVSAGQVYKFLPLEREVHTIEKHMLSRLWHDLKAENAPLRALVNGKLISVPEDFYDHIIVKNIPDGEFVMARLIGTVLGTYALGVGDGWYASRIKKMIADNKLEIVQDKDAARPYGKVLRNASE